MRIHNRSASEGLQPTLSAAGTDGSRGGEASAVAPVASAANDAVQLSYLSGVLNSLQTGAKNSAAKTDCVARLVQQNKYQVNAIAISRKLIADSLQ